MGGINRGSNLPEYAARNSFTSKLLVLLSHNTLLSQGFCTPSLEGGTMAKSRTDPQVPCLSAHASLGRGSPYIIEAFPLSKIDGLL